MVAICGVARGQSVTIDGSQRFQTIAGFGANIHYHAWTNNELKPVIDALIDPGGFNLFRVIFDNADWEATNDNNDSTVMNWSYYNSVYSSAKFQQLWGLIGYLNQRGISNGIVLNFQGPGPSWMGQPLTAGKEDEWAEMIASLLIYARTNQHLQFTLVAPDNEPNTLNEGIGASATQLATMYHDLAVKLDANGMSDIRFIGPDLANGTTADMPQLIADPVVMAKLATFGVHSYASGGMDSSGVTNYLSGTAYADRGFWMTEYNVWCTTCEGGAGNFMDWTYNRQTAEYLLAHLDNGAAAGIVWEGYDSQENTMNGLWSYWGLYGVDDINASPKTYTARKDFYTLSQIAKYVRPGAKKLAVNGSTGGLIVQAYFCPTGFERLSVVGVNSNSTSRTLSLTLASLPVYSNLDLYYTSSATNWCYAGSVAVANNALSATIPANCVFALSGLMVPPASPTLQATVTPFGLQLGWPLTASNFTLESTTFLPCTNWSCVTNLLRSSNGLLQTVVSASSNRQWFRLRWP